MPRKTKEEAQETRQRILDAAERVFQMQGVSRTSLAHIADAAGAAAVKAGTLTVGLLGTAFTMEQDFLKSRLAAQGLTNKAIGAELFISDRTVQGHLANIYAKLGVTTRTEAVTKALKVGWLVLHGR